MISIRCGGWILLLLLLLLLIWSNGLLIDHPISPFECVIMYASVSYNSFVESTQWTLPPINGIPYIRGLTGVVWSSKSVTITAAISRTVAALYLPGWAPSFGFLIFVFTTIWYEFNFSWSIFDTCSSRSLYIGFTVLIISRRSLIILLTCAASSWLIETCFPGSVKYACIFLTGSLSFR